MTTALAEQEPVAVSRRIGPDDRVYWNGRILEQDGDWENGVILKSVDDDRRLCEAFAYTTIASLCAEGKLLIEFGYHSRVDAIRPTPRPNSYFEPDP